MSDFGDGIAKAMATMFVLTIVVSAVLGWLLIEGIIWLFNHISIGVTP